MESNGLVVVDLLGNAPECRLFHACRLAWIRPGARSSASSSTNPHWKSMSQKNRSTMASKSIVSMMYRSTLAS